MTSRLPGTKLIWILEGFVYLKPKFCTIETKLTFTGKKIDSWLSVNWKTGKKTEVLNFNELEKTCPVAALDNIFIGRTGRLL